MAPKSLKSCAVKAKTVDEKMALARKRVRSLRPLGEDTTLSVAKSLEDYDQAFRLTHEAYLEEGIVQSNASGIRLTKYHLFPTTTTIVLKNSDRVVGTLSIIQSDPVDVPSAQLMPGLGESTKKYAEISSFAIHPEWRGGNGLPLFALSCYSLRYCFDSLDHDQVIISVHPNHAFFYETFFGFEKHESTQRDNYDFANGAAVVCLTLDRKRFYRWMEEKYSDSPEQSNLHQFLWGEDSSIIYPDREIYRRFDSKLAKDYYTSIFKANDFPFEKLTINELMSLESLGVSVNGLMDKLKRFLPRQRQKDPRLPVFGKGWLISHQLQRFETLNLSQSGMKIQLLDASSSAIEPGTRLGMRVELGKGLMLNSKLIVRWRNPNGQLGLELETKNQYAWQNLNSQLMDMWFGDQEISQAA